MCANIMRTFYKIYECIVLVYYDFSSLSSSSEMKPSAADCVKVCIMVNIADSADSGYIPMAHLIWQLDNRYIIIKYIERSANLWIFNLINSKCYELATLSLTPIDIIE